MAVVICLRFFGEELGLEVLDSVDALGGKPASSAGGMPTLPAFGFVFYQHRLSVLVDLVLDSFLCGLLKQTLVRLVSIVYLHLRWLGIKSFPYLLVGQDLTSYSRSPADWAFFHECVGLINLA